MRFLFTLLLSFACLATTLESNAADIPVKQINPHSEYKAVEQAIPNDALNDYHSATVQGSIIPNTSLQKTSFSYFSGNTEQNLRAHIQNDSFQNIYLFYSLSYAKTFRSKLIFPQHYHW